MKYYRWNTMTDFSCIGADCPDTCCAGWIVYVDKKTAGFYRNQTGEFGEKLRESLLPFEKNYDKIKLDDKGRYPMLTEENLCEIYQKLGKDKMCSICKRYPRFMEEVAENSTFVGYYLSCPEVARKFLCQRNEAEMSIYESGKTVSVPQEKQQNYGRHFLM